MPMQSIRTLLVEDDVERTSSIQSKLKSARGESFAVERHRTLDSAVSRVRDGDIDVVLLDLALPDSSGVDSVVRLYEAAPDVPIVVMTEAEDEDLALRSLQARAQAYVVKRDTDRRALERTIRHALERQRVQVDLKRDAHALERNEAKFRNVLATSNAGVVVVSQDGAVLFANSSATRLVGRPAEELRGTMLGYPFAPRARHEVIVDSERVIEVHIVEIEWDGAPVWLASLFDITSHKRYRADLEDVAARMQSANTSLERLASIDPLTELLNRRGLDAELAIENRRMRRTGAPLAAVLLDCDDFKHINETLGHAGGDAVLKGLAERLKDSLRPSDHIGRIGGDEFLVLLPDTRFAEAFQVAERLRVSVFDHPMRSPAGDVHVTASLGIELVSDESLSIDEVVARTQAALQQSKRSGKNRVSTSDGSATDSEDVVRGLQAETAYRVLRQPIVRLADESVVAWELMPRGPAGIFEMPRDFFRLALERNILTEVDLNCLRTCIHRACEVPTAARCHVDLFPSTLLETPRERLIELFAHRTAVRRWCIELSEQHFIGEPALLREHVRALKDAGIQVAISDVGFGRSSLETLILLEPDVVKLDRKFVHRTARDAERQRSLRRMVGVVGSLGGELVAEGIDSREDLELLLELGVPCGQGVLWEALA
ncbi:MAG: diguanylate cyclase [Planctomycetes bacterium]|nr:diguanylate cyclase [Planctomycetota bacterium]